MMMARDETPPRPDLDAAAVDALRSALLAYHDDGNEESGALRSALRRIAEDARAKQMHAERLLLILKDVWYGLPPIRKTPDGEQQTRMLQRVVTLCIREYYSA